MAPRADDDIEMEDVEYVEEDGDEGYQMPVRSFNIGPILRGARLRLAVAPSAKSKSGQSSNQAVKTSDPDLFVQRNPNEEHEDLFWMKD